MSWSLPFAVDEVWESTTQGAIPSAILGKTFHDPDNGNLVQVVKNTDISALAGGEFVRWEDAPTYEVDKTATSGMVTGAGIVHPALATRGKTVPVNAAFMIVKTGPTTCLAGAATTAGAIVISDGTDGRIQVGVAGNSPAAVYGVVYEVGSAGAPSVFCNVNFP